MQSVILIDICNSLYLFIPITYTPDVALFCSLLIVKS